MNRMSLEELKAFYRDSLFNNLLSFWMRFGVDRDNGGYFTCFNNSGDRLVSRNKYIWSQGRFLWMLSRAYYGFRDYVDRATAERYLEAARQGAGFLKQHSLLPNGNCAWVLDEKGHPIITDREGNTVEEPEGAEYDIGITADEFLIYGMGEYARAAEDQQCFDFALKLFDSVYERLEKGTAKSFPHVTPAGYKAHGDPMIMLETAQELADIADFFSDPAAEKLNRIARSAMQEILSVFVREEDQLLLEFVKKDGRPAYDEMLGSCINPGHSIEDAWFMIHFAERTSDDNALWKAIQIVRWMTSLGWDSEYGGLPQFVHREGGPPRGAVREENRDEPMIRELQENWSNKLWWVHSEALYALMLAFRHSGESWFLDTYWKFHDYVFATFPNPNREIGEWIQIRDRQGRPEDKVVALPVKDPYHITRAFMHIIRSLERLTA
jgi:N-acylglucosamine 2-epimerase